MIRIGMRRKGGRLAGRVLSTGIALLAAGLLLCFLDARQAEAQAPRDTTRFSSADVEGLPPGTATTKVMVLGTPHLARLAGRFRPELVDELIDVLAAFRPDAIAVESLPPDAILSMQAQAAYDSVVTRFAGASVALAETARERLSVSTDAATREADSLLTVAEKDGLGDVDRTRLVNVLLASYRTDTAALQWTYLSDAARRAAPVPDRTRSYLENRRTRPHEIDAVGARLAHRLGLQRLTPVDDHRDKDLLFDFGPELQSALPPDSLVALDAFIGRVWERRNRAVRRGNLLPFYQAINRPAFLRADVEAQWLLFLRTNLPSGLDRSRLALWEARNLHVAANIRRLSARHPGGRVLVLFGASHKPFLDASLDAMLGVERVDLKDVVGHGPAESKSSGAPDPSPDPEGE